MESRISSIVLSQTLAKISSDLKKDKAFVFKGGRFDPSTKGSTDLDCDVLFRLNVLPDRNNVDQKFCLGILVNQRNELSTSIWDPSLRKVTVSMVHLDRYAHKSKSGELIENTSSRHGSEEIFYEEQSSATSVDLNNVFERHARLLQAWLSKSYPTAP